MFQKIKDKLLEYTDYPTDKITENTEIIKDLQLSSLDIMMILGDLEAEYDIQFESEEIMNIVTVGNFANLLIEKVGK